jgi:stage V sporulation protein G
MPKAPYSKAEIDSAKENRSVFETLVCTSVQVYLVKEIRSKVRAFARVILNSQIQLTGIRVIEGEHGLFIGFPLDPVHKGEDFQNIYYPITRELKDHMETCVLEKYHEILKVS